MSEVADCTATTRLHSSQVALSVLKQYFLLSRALDKRRLDRERCLSNPVASVGESWDRDPDHRLGACVVPPPLGVSMSDRNNVTPPS